MIEIGAKESNLPTQSPQPKGHAIQVRIYAEDPFKNFQPSAGLLTQVSFSAI